MIDLTSFVLAATVTFTLPSFNAGIGCAVGTSALTDLDSAYCWMQVSGTKVPRLVWRAQVRGLEGTSQVVTIPTDSVATVWVLTRDRAGNFSCQSNLTGVNLTLDVPHGELLVRWYDIAGRRIQKPSMPGVYFLRLGLGPAQMKIIR